MNNIYSFNERLKELRLERKLSQRQFSTLIGYSQANISDWEAGLVQPTAFAIIACAEFFDVSTDYLLGLEREDGTKIGAYNCSGASAKNTEAEMDLLSTFKQLALSNRMKLLGFGKGLLESQSKSKE